MKQKWIHFLFLFALLFNAVPHFVRATTLPDIVISEIAWAGSSTSNADEWIELSNTSAQEVDVSGWSLSGASSSPIVFPVDTRISPHSTFLIANYANTNSSSTLNTPPQIITTMVSIPNDKITLVLTAPDRGVVDSAGNGGAPFSGKSGGTGSAVDGRFRTMERRDFLMDGSTKEAWFDADASNGFKENITDYGTPGNLNAYLTSQILTPETMVLPPTPVEIPLVTDPIMTEPEQLCEDIVVDAPTIAIVPILEIQTPVSEPVITPEPVATIANTPDATQTEIETTTVTVDLVTPSSPQGTLQIHEIYPHPATGESEWVELQNTSNNPVTTNGWSLLDASGAATLLPDGLVNAGSFLVIENPKGKLNNDGDSVILKNASGSVIDSILYNSDLGGVPNIGESLVRENANTLTLTTTPTKNSSNILTPRPIISSSTSTVSTTVTETPVEPVATNTENTVITQTPVATTNDQQGQNQPAPIIKTLRLSEIYPNTGGNDLTDEFIEIENTGDQAVSLNGWSLTDASGTKFSFANESMIGAHSFKVFLHPETKIMLNNTGDTITLTAPDGSVSDSQTYAQTKSALSYARSGDLWNWTTTRTPNEPNVVSGNSDPIPTTTPNTTTESSNSSPTTQSIGANTSSVLTIDEVKHLADGARVKVHGVVTALPNTFNSQTMYIQDETGGIQLFKSDCLFPALVEGQSITATGVLSHVNGEARIKITNQKSLIAGSVGETITPTSDTSSVGSLLTIAGVVVSRSGNRLALNVDGETLKVDLPKSNTKTYVKGSNIQVSGILATTKSGNVLKARTEKDIMVLPKEKTEQITSPAVAVGSVEQNQTLAFVLVGLASLAFLGLKFRPNLYALMQSYGRKQPLPSRP
jgi:DNA/RNA endonuclease YhcR with UshA esterase domain